MRTILVVGGGYAGFYTAWKLEKKLRRGEARVIVVDPRPYMTYQPFLPEVLAGSVESRHAAVSLRRHLRRTTVIAGSVTAIDHAQPDGHRPPGHRTRVSGRLRHRRRHRRRGNAPAGRPRRRRARDRHEARRGGRGDPGPAADGLRPGLGARARSAAPAASHRDVRRRRFLRRRGLRRAAIAGHGAAKEVLSRAEPGRAELPPRGGARPDTPRGVRPARALGGAVAGEARRSCAPQCRTSLGPQRSRGPVHRRGVRLRTDRLDGRQRREPDGPQPHRPAHRPERDADRPRRPAGRHRYRPWRRAGARRLGRGRRRRSARPGRQTARRRHGAQRPERGAAGKAAGEQHRRHVARPQAEAVRASQPRHDRHARYRPRHLPVPRPGHQGVSRLADPSRVPRAGRTDLGAEDPGPGGLVHRRAVRPGHRLAGLGSAPQGGVPRRRRPDPWPLRRPPRRPRFRSMPDR